MPLPDNAWTRSRCAYKALQYMAAGIPVVADDVGISAAVIGHEQGGLIAEDTSAWTIHLRRLAGDARLREKLGEAGRDRWRATTPSRPGRRRWRRYCAEPVDASLFASTLGYRRVEPGKDAVLRIAWD